MRDNTYLRDSAPPERACWAAAGPGASRLAHWLRLHGVEVPAEPSRLKLLSEDLGWLAAVEGTGPPEGAALRMAGLLLRDVADFYDYPIPFSALETRTCHAVNSYEPGEREVPGGRGGEPKADRRVKVTFEVSAVERYAWKVLAARLGVSGRELFRRAMAEWSRDLNERLEADADRPRGRRGRGG